MPVTVEVTGHEEDMVRPDFDAGQASPEESMGEAFKLDIAIGKVEDILPEFLECPCDAVIVRHIGILSDIGEGTSRIALPDIHQPQPTAGFKDSGIRIFQAVDEKVVADRCVQEDMTRIRKLQRMLGQAEGDAERRELRCLFLRQVPVADELSAGVHELQVWVSFHRGIEGNELLRKDDMETQCLEFKSFRFRGPVIHEEVALRHSGYHNRNLPGGCG